MDECVRVGVDAWIIQDGNYGDFRAGRRYPFALELSSPTYLRLRHPDAISVPSMKWISGSTYSVDAKVSYLGQGWCVLDAGLQLYTGQPLPGDWEVGSNLRGHVDVLIDHFAYFEKWAREPDAPALIHDWRVEKIELETTPLVATQSGLLVRGVSRFTWKEVARTRAWTHAGTGRYVLTCTRLSEAPRHSRRQTAEVTRKGADAH